MKSFLREWFYGWATTAIVLFLASVIWVGSVIAASYPTTLRITSTYPLIVVGSALAFAAYVRYARRLRGEVSLLLVLNMVAELSVLLVGFSVLNLGLLNYFPGVPALGIGSVSGVLLGAAVAVMARGAILFFVDAGRLRNMRVRLLPPLFARPRRRRSPYRRTDRRTDDAGGE